CALPSALIDAGRGRRPTGNRQLASRRYQVSALSGRLHLGIVFAEVCQAIEAGALVQCFLTGLELLFLATPRVERRRLQRPAVGKRKLPGKRAHLVHQAEMLRSLLGGLSTGKECDARDLGWHVL